MSTSRYLLAGLLFILAASTQVNAQTSVDTRVQKLEETIQILERRVASLEAQLRERSTPARVAPGKENWRKLEKGMSKGDVEQLLGSPPKVDEYGVITIWYYGKGQVRFDGDSQTVEAWFEP